MSHISTGKFTVSTSVVYVDPRTNQSRARKMTLVADWNCSDEQEAQRQYQQWRDANPTMHLAGSYEVFFNY